MILAFWNISVEEEEEEINNNEKPSGRMTFPGPPKKKRLQTVNGTAVARWKSPYKLHDNTTMRDVEAAGGRSCEPLHRMWGMQWSKKHSEPILYIRKRFDPDIDTSSNWKTSSWWALSNLKYGFAAPQNINLNIFGICEVECKSYSAGKFFIRTT